MRFSTVLVALAATSVSASPMAQASQTTTPGLNPPRPTTTTTTTPTTTTTTTLTTTLSTTAAATSPNLLGNPSASPNPRANENFVGSLLTANSATNKLKKVQEAVASGNASFKYDFSPAANPQQKPGAGGEVVVANRVNFPWATGNDIAGAAFFFAPCGLNTPHIHPRGSEFFTVATNSNIRTGFVLENGATTEINTNLTQYQGTLFPMGSIHWQQNESCEPAVAIGALSADDPGSSSIAPNFFVNTDGEIVRAALGYPEQITSENFGSLKAKIAPSFVKGVQSCYQRCGIKY